MYLLPVAMFLLVVLICPVSKTVVCGITIHHQSNRLTKNVTNRF